MTPIRTLVALAGALLAMALVTLNVLHVVAPQRDGLLALSQILAPYLFLLLVPFLLLVRTPARAGRLLRWGLMLAALAFVLRFVPGWVPFPGAAPAIAAGTPRLAIATWNLELGQPEDHEVVTTLLALDADIVGLVELTPAHAEAIQADPALRSRYPTMDLHPRDGSLGIGLLASQSASGRPHASTDPPTVVRRLEVPGGGPLIVVVAHPLPARIETAAGGLPVGYDATSRDRHLAQVRSVVDPLLATGDPLLLIGDFNVVDREPGYAELAAGLIDLHRAVGLGPGHTWRPGRLEWLPFGLLRIDLLFAANGVTPVSIAPDCTPRGSDHCLLAGSVALP